MSQLEAKGRKYHSARNLVWGICAQLIMSLFNFIIRTVIVRNLGLEYVSLNGLFNEIISMLTLSELGIGTAITYSLYKPIATNDVDKMCQLMTLYKKAYRVIALIIGGIGLILSPFIPDMVKDIGFPDGYIRVIFLLFVCKTACSYFYSYKSGIISANQRMYIVTTINSAFSIASSLISLGVLLITKEFAAYLIVQIVFTLLCNMYISRKADKEYPFLKKSMELPKEESKAIFKNIRSVFIGKASGTITNSTDNILITLLVGTLSVGLYSNYSMVFGMLRGILVQFQSAVTASFGNLFATDTKQRCERTLGYLTYIMGLLGCVCAACLYCSMTPLVILWLGDEYTISTSVLFVLSCNFFFATTRLPLWIAMTVSGLFKWDKYTSIAGSVSNLIVSVLLGLKWGMLGIFIGTSVTHIVQIVSKDMLLYKKFFEMPHVKSLLRWLIYSALCLGCMTLSYWVCGFISAGGILGLLLRVLVPAVITGSIFVMLTFKTYEFKRLTGSIKTYAGKALKRLRRGAK